MTLASGLALFVVFYLHMLTLDPLPLLLSAWRLIVFRSTWTVSTAATISILGPTLASARLDASSLSSRYCTSLTAVDQPEVFPTCPPRASASPHQRRLAANSTNPILPCIFGSFPQVHLSGTNHHWSEYVPFSPTRPKSLIVGGFHHCLPFFKNVATSGGRLSVGIYPHAASTSNHTFTKFPHCGPHFCPLRTPHACCASPGAILPCLCATTRGGGVRPWGLPPPDSCHALATPSPTLFLEGILSFIAGGRWSIVIAISSPLPFDSPVSSGGGRGCAGPHSASALASEPPSGALPVRTPAPGRAAGTSPEPLSTVTTRA
ncbi:hypothetical protein DFH09DRAFT_1313491 [Mycena vulgaris]|nr:hypothetical protein DFH09DRAFT_1313491 [Mycena vulgaris]